ncbi:glycerol dehydratase reactivase beta/small subunit family protein [Halalkalicoccus subterraneus]|uniref:glycerol dehydratase reactivase beta/small subunit family protein n=1 Tax=Halalkalicoccus subterraneus TaxID=2675002 RepID=UPI000EFB445C|nr:glycerol dehydratase reactivase beta/small subunit family protein [Halalkalicoccus subterraneus]
MSDTRTQSAADEAVPRIHIRYVGEEPSTLEYIEHGIEEEGVPWRTHAVEEDEDSPDEPSRELAFRAASESGLKIGIGIDRDARHTLHHARLPPEEPVQRARVETDSQARAVGANAARLAKRMPLEPIEEDSENRERE